MESMGTNASTGPEAVAAAERHAAVLTARAGARDPSAVPSVCRISAALQYPAGELFHCLHYSRFSYVWCTVYICSKSFSCGLKILMSYLIS